MRISETTGLTSSDDDQGPDRLGFDVYLSAKYENESLAKILFDAKLVKPA